MVLIIVFVLIYFCLCFGDLLDGCGCWCCVDVDVMMECDV